MISDLQVFDIHLRYKISLSMAYWDYMLTDVHKDTNSYP